MSASCGGVDGRVERGADAPAPSEISTQAARDGALADGGVERLQNAAGGAQEGRAFLSDVLRPLPSSVPVRVCSVELPLCVHAPAGAAWSGVREMLAALEDAQRVYDTLGLPRPRDDEGRGGGPEYDVYLSADVVPLSPRPGQDLPALALGYDSASSFALVALPRAAVGGGCWVGADMAYALGHAIGVRADGGVAAGELSMLASHLASIAAPCPIAELPAVATFQRTPERSLMGGSAGGRDGSMLFGRYLDDVYGTGVPGRVLLGLLSIAWQQTPVGSLHFRNEPDMFDALRFSLQARDRNLDGVLLDFAVARAFVGGRSDGLHLSDVAWLGEAGRIRLDWSIPFASLPRRLAPLRPIEPTGATYVWLDLATVGDADEVTVVADWETTALFRWAVVRVDRAGAEAGRVEFGGVYGETRAQRTVIGLSGLSGLLVVGVNLGGDDRSQPFDPEHPTSARGCTVWFAR
ncbi:hypothetical protein [Chondromyces crocatus]|nr:hypothetical protein [Chondromyces crocatus]